MRLDQSDFRNWKEHPVTKAFEEDLLDVLDNNIAILSTEAGRDPLTDRWRVGLISGLRALVEWAPTIEETEDAVSGEGT